MTPIEYVIKLIADAINALKGLSLSGLGIDNMNLFNFAVATLLGSSALYLLKGDNDDD